MKILIRADSSFKIGHGHIQRCLILAKQYERLGHEVSFACLELEGNIIGKIPNEVFLLESSSLNELCSLIEDEGFTLLVIDNYAFSEQDERAIKAMCEVQILSFDDEIKPHFCDILLNVNAYAKPALYKNLVPLNCELRCGFSYALIREEFYEEAKKKRKKIWDIFICMGGTDSKNFSAKIALDFPKSFKILIATTSANKNLKALKHLAQNSPNISLAVDLEHFAKAMNESKKLIIQASSLVNEALLLKANFKAICTHKNQEKIAKWLLEKDYEVEYR
ncbi:UDP-2,4-diacetamido-2,4,6-trideoxy-beta-L-altropyranose hydrolase [Campylobacter helveticus]|uniref:UDP-2,4-diacetamido-2,4, 6-trideoxy-beta-L-altropyranose hydrolase n=1 Tax=Campylobacter helveticus TaxID=28898 RepID=A0AAX2UK61_9BACT|nr:UDP-2,4-diacetamido-2,4,6-trideoxy-beta-L-altropyranose hydrolase [Campylobacter helveticus]MCR2055960.1 UDP-2,4-diacetamido-2,4,6-trideoxy-beta-L-altropyranose hydrolase [Campylobacter helveticus]MCR2059568.1 UDP-2,4-diacetamido-2,4,6-trideoxy-beta-L-altropyranose hydrolase [Campylobacter helveticus]MCR2061275.1 UDP-2,4-diacetamido-2,4,6-trideoxy-beta-L-altropyranose hydrolase [Campylobacter helveticus]MCR2063812.1 UDP-2,4-diacetamido-2,4,6-trideoxy-beta-L-altropyranose hydrolase [Campyloba